MLKTESDKTNHVASSRASNTIHVPEEPDTVSTKAEAGLSSEAVEIKEQARQAHPLNKGENLLQSVPADPISP